MPGGVFDYSANGEHVYNLGTQKTWRAKAKPDYIRMSLRVCCEELDTMSPRDLNQLKAAVTMQSIDERAAYAHYHEHRSHIATFCGTGNNAQFLSDPTGNRHWLPFEVESIQSPREHLFCYEGIYARVVRLIVEYLGEP